MKQQILKLAKRLNNFSINEVAIMSETDEMNVQKILDELENEGFIKKISPLNYLYIPKLGNYNKLVIKSKDFTKPEDYISDEEANKIQNLSINSKKTVTKYLILIKAAENLGGNVLEDFLKLFGNENPEYKTSFSSFMRARYKYYHYGIKGIIPKYGQTLGKSVLSQDNYEIFKKLYLSTECLTPKICINSMKNMGCFEAEELVPAPQTFIRKIKADYTEEQIIKYRTAAIKIPKINNNTIKNDSIFKTDSFIEAAVAYLKSNELLKNMESKTIKSALNCHLIPFFREYKFSEINFEVLNKFKLKKIEEGLSSGSIKRFLVYLRYITNKHSIVPSNIIFAPSHISASKEVPEKAECLRLINKSRNTNLYLPLLLIMSIGLTYSEAQALTWEDINLTQRKVIVNKIFYKGKITKYRMKHQIRELKIPLTLHRILTPRKEEAMKMFKPFSNNDLSELTQNKNLTFKNIRDSYIKDLIDNKIPINLIAKQLGFVHTNEFLSEYENYIDKSLLEKYDPLK